MAANEPEVIVETRTIRSDCETCGHDAYTHSWGGLFSGCMFMGTVQEPGCQANCVQYVGTSHVEERRVGPWVKIETIEDEMVSDMKRGSKR